MSFNIRPMLLFSIVLFSSTPLFGGQLLFTPRISADNQYYHKEYKEGEDPREHDLVTTVSPGFSVDYLEKRYGAALSYDAGFSSYRQESGNNATRHNGRVHAWVDLGKNTRLSLTDSLFQSEDPGQRRDEEGEVDYREEIDGTLRRGRFSYLRNTATLNLTHRFGKDDTVRFSYLESFLRNDDPAKDDNSRRTPSVDLSYWWNPRWGIEVSTSYAMGEFDEGEDQTSWDSRLKLIRKISGQFDTFLQYRHTVVEYDGESEDYSVYNPVAGIRYRFDKDTSMTFGVGYYIKDNDIAEDEGEVSVDGDITRKWKIGRGSVRLTGAAGYQNASFGSENLGFNVFYRADCRGDYPFTRNLSGTILTSYRYDTYNDVDDRTDQNIRAVLGMNYRILKWLSAGIDYSYELLESTEEENEFDENRLTFNIKIIPSKPVRMGR